MSAEEHGLFKFKVGRKRTRNKQNGSKPKVNNPSKEFKKLYNVNTNGKIKKRSAKKVKLVKKQSIPRQEYDIKELEDKIQKLKDTQEPNKKVRKKLRQLEHLHKRILQKLLTDQSLGLIGDGNEKKECEETDIKIVNDEKPEEDESSDASDVENGVKRFVLFVGNLPKEVQEKDILEHFKKVGVIKSVRIPDSKESRKNGFAFIELEDRISYEKTLSMHHTMLKNKRINVLYTAPEGKDFDKKEIMKKNAKLDALRKAGKLAGSIAEHKKRSFRRKKKRLAEAKASAMIK